MDTSNDQAAVQAVVQQVDLGRPVVCLNVAELPAAIDFYTKLGFTQTGGGTDDSAAVLTNPSVELRLLHGRYAANALLLAGSDPEAVKGLLATAGIAAAEADGGLLIEDPAGLLVQFDVGPAAGQPVVTPAKPEPQATLPYGEFVWAIPVADAPACVEFFKQLGFTVTLAEVEDDYKWFELDAPGAVQFRISFSEEVTPGQMLMFHGGDVYAIEKALLANGLTMDIPAQKGLDGVDSMMLRDPDGNMVCFHGPQPVPAGE